MHELCCIEGQHYLLRSFKNKYFKTVNIWFGNLSIFFKVRCYQPFLLIIREVYALGNLESNTKEVRQLS